MSNTLDYYEILNITQDADDKAIKKSYRKLALKYHPDKNNAPEAVEKFKDISEAYEILSDPEKRKIYDNRGSNDFTNDNYEYNPFAGFEFHRPEDVFADFFNHMNGLNGGGFNDPFFMMPQMLNPFGNSGFNNHPFMGHSMMQSSFAPPMDFMGSQQHGFSHPLMMGGNGFRAKASSSSSSSFSRSGGSGNYSKSVSTSTRSVNGVVQSVKITKITDENGTNVTEEYSNGTVKINGIEQPSNKTARIESSSNNNNSARKKIKKVRAESDMLNEKDDSSDEDAELVINQHDRQKVDFKEMEQRLREQIELKYEQEERMQWEQQRRHEMYLQQQQQLQLQQQQLQQQQQMLYYQEQMRQQQQHMYTSYPAPSNYYHDEVYYHASSPNPSSSYYPHLY